MKHRDYCGVCGGKRLVQVLDLGAMPLANAFLKKEDFINESKYPLQVYFCRTCSSVQLLDIVDPNIVFKKYEYLTSASKPLSDHFRAMGQELVERFKVKPDDWVIEVGGNDGVLLEAIKDKCLTLNIEPAETAARLSRKRGILTACHFLNEIDLRDEAKVVIGTNVFAHIDDIQGAFMKVRDVLRPDGVFVIEVHWVGNLIGDGGFDQVYHEHLYYHSLSALNYLCRTCQMRIFDVETVPIHGESIRVYMCKDDRKALESVEQFLVMERGLGLDKEYAYLDFHDKIYYNKLQLQKLLRELPGKTVGYGAPAKGNTLINYYDLDLDYVVDTTPGKQGLYTPGKHIPVYSPMQLVHDPPDNVVILAWNYADEILRKEREMKDWGVKFIIPVPKVRVV